MKTRSKRYKKLKEQLKSLKVKNFELAIGEIKKRLIQNLKNPLTFHLK